jgi:hypothetical protein
MRRFLTTQDVVNALWFNVRELATDDLSGNDFDKVTDHIFRLMEKLIYMCKGSVPNARVRLEAEGLEDYLDMYLEMCL